MPENLPTSENSNSHPSADGTPAAADNSPDRRSAPRRKRLLRVQLVDEIAGRQAFPGWVVDRSVGGMCIEVDHELEIGATLRVRRFEGEHPWVDVRVQSQRLIESSWHLGCQFVRSPSWEALMQFG